MDAALKAKWVEALRSGEFKQTQGALRNSTTGGYCCLGVLACIAGLEFEDHQFSNSIIRDGKLDGYKPISELIGAGDLSGLWYRNDGQYGHEPHSFSEIADYIEEHL